MAVSSSFNRTLALYSMRARSRAPVAPRQNMPKYTKLAPLTLRLSYSQMAVTLYTPSRDTPSMTNSVPERNSWHSAPWLVWPNPLAWPLMARKASSASAALLHKNTLSVPALSLGFTTHLNGEPLSSAVSSSQKAVTSASDRANACVTARTPRRRISSCMMYLFRRACVISSPLLRVPKRAANISANSTPVSAPGKMAMTGAGWLAILSSVSATAAAWSSCKLSCCTSNDELTAPAPEDTRAATGLSFSLNTKMSL